jgi:hypothetical protein
MGQVHTIHGAWSSLANGWASETLCLSGDTWLEVTLPSKGRIVIEKSEGPSGPWPKVFVSPWVGPAMRLRLYGATEERYVRIYLSENPKTIQYVNI